MKITLAVDAMGGDSAPDIVIEGMSLASRQYPELVYLLYGDEKKVRPLLSQYDVLKDRVTFHHTDECVTGDTRPGEAIRGLKKSSMRLAINAVAEGAADGVVSAGNTGAYMALSKIILKTLEEVDRPVIAGSVPTQKGMSALLDLGANVEASSTVLIQFAVIGEAYAHLVLGLSNPSVGLLNIGSEELKGRPEVREAREIISGSNIVKDFRGFVEADGIFSGDADVVVTDGFTGNMVLKTLEGTARMYRKYLRDATSESLLGKLGYLVASGAFKSFRKRIDPRLYNGAPFLGLRGVAVKSHGGADAVAFANALGIAINMVDKKVVERIAKDVGKLHLFYSGSEAHDCSSRSR